MVADGGVPRMALWPEARPEGLLLVADKRRGILQGAPVTGPVTPLLETFPSEGFKGVNDLTVALNGDLYFTDQGQTSLQDPTGRVFRFSKGRLEVLLFDIPSPNGLVLNLDETALYVAVARANAVWRVPQTPDGGVTKVGLWLQLSGDLAGPDDLTLDEMGDVIVAHPGTGVWRTDPLLGTARPSEDRHQYRGEHGRYLRRPDHRRRRGRVDVRADRRAARPARAGRRAR